MDMNKEDRVQYVAMQQLSYADIEPAVYEASYTPAGDDGGVTSVSWVRSLSPCPIDPIQYSINRSQFSQLQDTKCFKRTRLTTRTGKLA